MVEFYWIQCFWMKLEFVDVLGKLEIEPLINGCVIFCNGKNFENSRISNRIIYPFNRSA